MSFYHYTFNSNSKNAENILSIKKNDYICTKI